MLKLLIADDEPLVCVGLQTMLNWDEYGIEIVDTARNGRQASEMIERLRPHIVVSDIKMPVKSGLEVARECELLYGRLPFFIFLTSYEEFELVHKAIQLQAVDYLIKLELTIETLSAAITKAVGQLSGYEVAAAAKEQSIEALRDKFFMRLHNGLFESGEEYNRQREDLDIALFGNLFAAATCEMV